MTAPPPAFRFATGARTDVGAVRTHNEDALATLPDLGLWAVADGMGGHAAGDVASRILVEELASLGITVGAQDQRARVHERIERAHLRIREHAAAHRLGHVGTTVAALLIHGSEISCIWAGDSRIYLWRDGLLTPLTRDHSEVGAMVAKGLMTEEEARVSPRRNVILQAVGIGAHPAPSMVSGALRDGDRLLLCTDGLTEHLPDPELARLLAGSDAPDILSDRLVREAVARGGRDNVTVIVVDCVALPTDPEGA